ncbi:MAG: transporter substrate-binding domain-containing protein [Marinobacter sp.]|nr:transporter substrate-binding domain-containing protein [Marinobacter sp.]
MAWLKEALLACLWCSMVWGLQASGEERRVRVATLENYPPFCFYREGVERQTLEVVPPGSDAVSFQGFSWDVLRESFHARGYTIELVITPWARAMTNINQGNVELLFPTGKNLERASYLSYPKTPLNEVDFRVYVSRDADIVWEGLASLEGRTIGMVRGYNLGDDWMQLDGIDKYPVNSIEQGFRMLRLGRLDGFAGYEINWDYILKQMGLQGQFEKLPVFGSSKEYVVGLTRSPGTPHLLAEFEAGMAAIKENGTYQRLVERWQ